MREDWVEVDLGKICDVNMGQSPPSSTYNTEKIGLPFFQGKAEFTELYPVVRKWCSSPKKIANEGDILLSVRAPVGSINIANQKCAIGRGLAAISYKYSHKYIWYFLKNIEQILDSQGTGTTFKAISGNILKSQTLPLAPLPIQRAIVSKIEALFSDLDNGIIDLKKAQEQLKIYRQAVLSFSFPKKEKIEISKLVDELSQGWSPKCVNQSSTDSNQWAVIKTSAIQSGKFVEFENKILPESLVPREQHEIKEGDILITRAGPRVRVGICCLVKRTRPKLINCDKVYRLRLNPKIVVAEYFEYALNSPEILSKIEVMKSGSSDSGLNLTQKVFLKLEIPFTSIEKQRQVVQKIESRLSVCDKVEESITEALQKSEALRQSILKKAFEGKLLSSAEIEKCKQEKDYEPANELLKKIKAEKNK